MTSLSIYRYITYIKNRLFVPMYVPVPLFHMQTDVPISTKFCTDLHTISGKVLNTSLTPPSWPPYPVVPQPPKPKQVTQEKYITPLYFNVHGHLYLFSTSWGNTALLVWNLNIFCFVNNFVRCFLQLLVLLAPHPPRSKIRDIKLSLFYPCGSAEPFCQISVIWSDSLWHYKVMKS